jgi:hypothetical protein
MFELVHRNADDEKAGKLTLYHFFITALKVWLSSHR